MKSLNNHMAVGFGDIPDTSSLDFLEVFSGRGLLCCVWKLGCLLIYFVAGCAILTAGCEFYQLACANADDLHLQVCANMCVCENTGFFSLWSFLNQFDN